MNTGANDSLPKPTFESELVEAKASTIPNCGLGLFAKVDLGKNQRICRYFGEEMPWKMYREQYPEGLKRYYYKGRNIFVIVSNREPYLTGNPVNYCNHREKPNVVLKRRYLYTTEPIAVGSELFLTYPKHYLKHFQIS